MWLGGFNLLNEFLLDKSLNLIYKMNFILLSEINLIFNLGKNKFEMFFFNNFVYYFYLPSFFFFKSGENYLKLIFLKKSVWNSFLKNLFNNYLFSKNVYFFRLKIKGLGFFVKRISKDFLHFFMALNHYYYFHVSDLVYYKKKKKHFIFISNKQHKLNIIFWNLLFLKKHNVYVKVRGLSGFVKPNLIRLVRKKNKL